MNRKRTDKTAQDRKTVLDAVFTILHNPQTPNELYDKVAQWCCEQSNEVSDDFWHSESMLAAVFSTVVDSDTMGAERAKRVKR